MTTISVELERLFALSDGPGGVNAGSVSSAFNSAVSACAWGEEAPLLDVLGLLELAGVLGLEELLDVLGLEELLELLELELPDELQAASVRAPVASSTPIAAGLANREDPV
jgi:hypothetical protein